ncbi:hypothetical protein HMPREF1981_03615 [Bacteroides pyogenes F0041]|uniref:Uncharacterized protein n=1 Tax=Bacteroides pyogenes F0041 TaxID=1321819 RepID=U2DMA5_9BACE|nr:hypothetical protein HMPREF1981_03615 [Bacteroides pyogenes F0041]
MKRQISPALSASPIPGHALQPLVEPFCRGAYLDIVKVPTSTWSRVRSRHPRESDVDIPSSGGNLSPPRLYEMFTISASLSDASLCQARL